MGPSGGSWTRRELCQFVTAASVGCVLGRQANAAPRALANDAYRPDYGVQGYAEPAPLRSVNGKLATAIRIVRARNWIGNDRVELRSYNGNLVGPTLRLRPGDRLELRLENHLPWLGGNAHNGHAAADFNSTNLHTHGLHVSPQSPADNVLVSILPKDAPTAAIPPAFVGACDYRYEIPRDHLPGTYWYHAHMHGSTAVQLASGMAGALIIEGDIDEVPEIKAANERTFVFQQIPYTDNGAGLYVVEDTDLDQLAGHFRGRFTTINGGVPILRLNPGAVERWRLVHGGIFELLSIDVVGCQQAFNPNAARIQDFCGEVATAAASDAIKFYPIARDGITLGSLEEIAGKPLPTLGPGNRMDILVKATKAGTYVLRKREQDAPMALNALARSVSLLSQGYSLKDAAAAVRDDPYALAVIVVEGEQKNMRLPGGEAMKALRRPFDFSAEQLSSVPSQMVEFKIAFHAGKVQPVVDGHPFDPSSLPRTLKLGNVEKWRITTVGSDPHPFHIHVNPFLLLEDENGPLEKPIWLDTYLIQASDTTLQRSIAFITRYQDFCGKFVLHCHNLVHEDQGMMQLVEVLPRPQGPLQSLQYYQPSNVPNTDQTFADRSGATVALRDFVGRVVLLSIWDTSCAACATELQALERLQRRSGSPDFAIMAVAQGESVASVDSFYASHGIKNLAAYVDPTRTLSQAFGSSGQELTLPRTVIVDRLGHPRGWLDASAAWDSPKFDELLNYFRTA